MEMCRLASSIILFLVLFFFLAPAVGDSKKESFDHLSTGYPLTGAHEDVKCRLCHVDGNFAGTTTICSFCHNNVIASGKSTIHPSINEECDECHSTILWSMVLPEVLVRNEGSRFDHGDNIDMCRRCHNGSKAGGKPINHINSGNSCEACHSLLVWKPVIRVDHGEVQGACNQCHNGISAKGKPVTHINSGSGCDDCHYSTAWKPVSRVNHDAVIGVCNSCHNGQVARGQPINHMQSMEECDTCHDTMVWLTVNYIHQSPIFVTHGPNVICRSCHQGGVNVVWPRIDLKPDCGGCHAAIFKTISHPKTNSKKDNLLYSVEELQDCTGACHLYRDSKLNKIKTMLIGIHNALGW